MLTKHVRPDAKRQREKTEAVSTAEKTRLGSSLERMNSSRTLLFQGGGFFHLTVVKSVAEWRPVCRGSTTLQFLREYCSPQFPHRLGVLTRLFG